MSNSNPASYEVLIVKCGEGESTKSQSYLNFGLSGQTDGPVEMNFYYWIARNEERTIVIDTGFSESGASSRGRRQTLDPRESLASLGISPDHVTAVILSHLHYDHAGNLDLFPTTDYIIAEDELRFWEGPHASRGQFAPGVDRSDIAHVSLAREQGRLQTFSDRLRPFPGIEIIQIGGHTLGQSVVTVQTSDGPVLIASDAAHFYDELEDDLLFTMITDVIGGYEAYDFIREQEKSGAHVLAGHDVAVFERYPAKRDGPMAGMVATIGSTV